MTRGHRAGVNAYDDVEYQEMIGLEALLPKRTIPAKLPEDKQEVLQLIR